VRILVVEDDRKTRGFLVKGFSESGFVAVGCEDGNAALGLLGSGTYDLILLDIMLPGRDGLSVLDSLRKAGGRTPVILLTAREGIGDRVNGLDLGADDYLVKPVAFSELLARVNAVVRRCAPDTPQELEFKGLRLHVQARCVWRDEREIHLEEDEFLLLHLLMRHAGEGISAAMLRESLSNSCERYLTLEDTLYRLRQRVDGQSDRELIHSLDGLAYQLA
jgi:DNA-binding response OmpR family regulator